MGGALVAWVVTLEIRFRSLQAKYLLSEEKNIDNETATKIHNLSDSDLNTRLAGVLGAGADTTTKK